MGRPLSLMGIGLLLSGCISVSAKLQLENTDVKPIALGSDCVPIVLGIGYGTATLEQAMRNAIRTEQTRTVDTPVLQIRKIRNVQLTDQQFVFVGSRCVEVTGEP